MTEGAVGKAFQPGRGQGIVAGGVQRLGFACGKRRFFVGEEQPRPQRIRIAQPVVDFLPQRVRFSALCEGFAHGGSDAAQRRLFSLHESEGLVRVFDVLLLGQLREHGLQLAYEGRRFALFSFAVGGAPADPQEFRRQRKGAVDGEQVFFPQDAVRLRQGVALFLQLFQLPLGEDGFGGAVFWQNAVVDPGQKQSPAVAGERSAEGAQQYAALGLGQQADFNVGERIVQQIRVFLRRYGVVSQQFHALVQQAAQHAPDLLLFFRCVQHPVFRQLQSALLQLLRHM